MSMLERDFINSNLARLVVGFTRFSKQMQSPKEELEATNDIMVAAQALGSRVLSDLNEAKDNLGRIAEALEGIRLEAEAARRGQ